jgi:hypothetical protein
MELIKADRSVAEVQAEIRCLVDALLARRRARAVVSD